MPQKDNKKKNEKRLTSNLKQSILAAKWDRKSLNNLRIDQQMQDQNGRENCISMATLFVKLNYFISINSIAALCNVHLAQITIIIAIIKMQYINQPYLFVLHC